MVRTWDFSGPIFQTLLTNHTVHDNTVIHVSIYVLNIPACPLEGHVRLNASSFIHSTFSCIFFKTATRIPPPRKWIQTWNKKQKSPSFFLSLAPPLCPPINIPARHTRLLACRWFKQAAWVKESRWDRRMTFDPQRKWGGNQKEVSEFPLRVSVLRWLRAEQLDRSGARTPSMP